MKIYTIIGGVNGVGKSSMTGLLRDERTDLGCIIDVDQLNALHGGDRIAGGRAAIAKIEACLKSGKSFTQETTLAGRRPAATARRAQDAGYYVRLYYVGLDTPEQSLQRIQNRVAWGGHDIPPDDVTRRFATRFDDLARILPFCNEAAFYDNTNGFRAVAEYRNGAFIPKGRRLPRWAEQLTDYFAKRGETIE